MERLDLLGKWWLPNQPHVEIGGRLEFFQPDQASLTLVGRFEGDFSPAVPHYRLVNGITTDGKHVTLYNCLNSTHTILGGGLETTTYTIQFVFIGWHFRDPEEIRFDKAWVELSHFFEWIGPPATQYKISKRPSLSTKLLFEAPEDIVIPTSHANFACEFSGTIGARRPKSYIDEHRRLRIEVKRAQPIEKLIADFVQPFQQFLALGVARPTFVEKMQCRTVVSETTVEVIYAQRSFKARNIDKQIHFLDMLFQLSDLPSPAKALQRWLNNRSRSFELRALYHDILRTPDMFLHLKFLSVAQALEKFHVINMQGAVIPKNEHDQRIKEILLTCPLQHRVWVKERLGKSNLKSFLMRIGEVMRRYQNVMTPIVLDSNWFVRKTRDSRNYFTHFDKKMKKSALDGADLHFHTERLLILLQSCLLRDVRFSAKDCPDIFSKFDPFMRLKAARHRGVAGLDGQQPS